MKTNNKNIKNIGLVAGGLVLTSLSVNASADLFSVTSLGSGGELRSELTSDLVESTFDYSNEYRTIEAKCGEKKSESKSKEAKCGEAKCGEKGKKAEAKCGEKGKAKEAKCGEAKCGEKGKKAEAKCGEKGKAKEHKCGEGKCGEKK